MASPPDAAEFSLFLDLTTTLGIQIRERKRPEPPTPTTIRALGVYIRDISRYSLLTAAEERALVLKVSDTGAGISEKNLARIFERFYTTERPATGQKGTGLGLSIALNIVKAHGGRIDARSEPGRGTQFTVVLPRAFDEDR